jgi:hypothetical protein
MSLTFKAMCLSLILLYSVLCKVKMEKEESRVRLRKSETVVIRITEGTREVYARCSEICKVEKAQLMYTEQTFFPGLGKLIRCQCGQSYTEWYKGYKDEAVGQDVLLGDELFNEYINLLGYDEDDCECDGMRNLLYKLYVNSDGSS